MTEIQAYAFAAGLVAALNPCGFAMLPAYLTLVVLGDGRDGQARGPIVAVLRALAATAMMTLGFLVVFGAFGLIVSPIARSANQYLPIVTVVIGVGLIGLGGWLLSGRELRVLLPKPTKGAPTGQLRSMALYGMAYALASLSCTMAPFLAVTAGTFRSGDLFGGVLAYAAYALGMGLLVGVLAVGVALARETVGRNLHRVLPYVNRVSGGLLLVVGGYVAYYGVYEVRLFHYGGSASDPVIDAARQVQSWASGKVQEIGWLPLLAVLVVAVAAAVGIVAAVNANRRHTRRPAPSPDPR